MYQLQFRQIYCLISILALLVLFTGTSCTNKGAKDPRNQTSLVSVEGSDTMGNLLKSWESSFEKEHEDIPVSISIQDSGAGIEALLKKSTDIAAASRDLTEEEQKKFHKKGLKIKRSMVALGSIAIIVNKENPVDKISVGNLRAIYSGEISDWGELGGVAGEKIAIMTRESDSGTYQYFTEHIMKRLDDKVVSYSSKNKVMTSNESMLKGVESNPNAIGYCGLSIAIKAKQKMLSIGLLKSSKAVEPSLKNVLNDYPLSRPLYLFYEADSKDSVNKFIEFCTGEKGQKIVTDCGYVSFKQ